LDEDPRLGNLPALGDVLHQAPARLQQLYQAFGLELLYRHDMHQVTIHATIAAIIADSDAPGHATTSHPETSDLECHQIPWLILHERSERQGRYRHGDVM
jgi:hypothetical protein